MTIINPTPKQVYKLLILKHKNKTDMKDLKITDVQVGCRELSQEQIDKMCEVVKAKGYKIKQNQIIIMKNWFYFSVDSISFGMHGFDTSQTLITYDQFINLFDKPKNSLKERLKELEDRLTLLEQKVSEKEQSINIEKGMQFYNHINNAYYDIIDVEDGLIRVKRQKRDGINKYNLIDVVKMVNTGLWELQNTIIEKKETEPQKGDICKFWNNDENSYEVGRYEKGCHIMYPNVNILTFESFKNAKVVSIDEALELFKKQLLNEK